MQTTKIVNVPAGGTVVGIGMLHVVIEDVRL